MSGTALPTVITAAGLQPQSPSSLLAQLLEIATIAAPGLTANLPGILIEDVSSTCVAGVSLADSARVEAVNNVTPNSSNPYVLTLQGNQFGFPQGVESNSSVYVVFTGTPGFPIPVGFLVGDGTYQYTVQDASVIPTSGVTGPVYCVATVYGTWPIAANTVTQVLSSYPNTITLSVTNPTTGTLSTGQETESEYRGRVLLGYQAAAQGVPATIKTALMNIPGVVPQLVSVKLITGTGYEVICGGGDPYSIANAIFLSVGDIALLTGSVMAVDNVTQANPGVVTTVLNHGYTNGQVVTFTGIQGMTNLNTGSYTVTVVTIKSFSIGTNTTGFPAYTGGGVVSPNLRNITVSISDYPDTYPITFVNPPQQLVNIGLTWNTTAVNFVSAAQVNQLGQAALISYVNGLGVGQPMNLFDMQDAFRNSVSSILAANLISRMVFTVEIDGIAVAATSGTGLYQGDPESYFFAYSATVAVAQG